MGEVTGKVRLLLDLMCDSYSPHPEQGWVRMETILAKTELSSFSQRFGEWEKAGIEVIHRFRTQGINRISEYKLTVNPGYIDRDNFRFRLVQEELFV